MDNEKDALYIKISSMLYAVELDEAKRNFGSEAQNIAALGMVRAANAFFAGVMSRDDYCTFIDSVYKQMLADASFIHNTREAPNARV